MERCVGHESHNVDITTNITNLTYVTSEHIHKLYGKPRLRDDIMSVIT